MHIIIYIILLYIFLYITCNKNVLLIVENIYKRSIYNLGYSVTIFSTFLQNELLMYVSINNLHIFKTASAIYLGLARARIRDVFSLQMSPRAT